MKILQVIPFFGPHHGGSARSTFEISKNLSMRGHEVTIFTSDCMLSQEWVDSLPEVKVRAFKTWSTWGNFFVTLDIVEQARHSVSEFDVIHMHNYRTFQNSVVSYFARKKGVPYVLQARGSLPVIMGKHQIKWVYDIISGYGLLKNASRVIALNDMEVCQYVNMGVPSSCISTIPNGIDMAEFSNLPSEGGFKKKFGLGKAEQVIFFLGRIHRIKGIDILVKAFADISNQFSRAKLVISGPDDGYLGELKTLISRLGLEKRVLLTGPLYGLSKLEAFVDSEFVVLPSRYETFPNSVLEANACFKPVVATNTGSLPQLIDDTVTGFLFENGNPDELSKHISRLLSDHEFTRGIGYKAHEFVKHNFSYDTVMDLLEKLYSELVNN